MVIKDCPEFFYLFWGAIKAGIVPVPLNTELRANDYKYFVEDSRCAAVIYSSEFAGEVEAAVAASTPRPRPRPAIEADHDPRLAAKRGAVPATPSAAQAAADDRRVRRHSSAS